MAHIDALIDKISDAALRGAVREQVDGLLKKNTFGLVYQDHKPETVELPNYRVQRNCKVKMRSRDSATLYKVERVTGSEVAVVSTYDAADKLVVPIDDVVVVREFGEPIYPGLKSWGEVRRGGDDPAHIVINGENYHALDTLRYAYENKVDAIYIDPPYNSGARDWKYNNDYVDGQDQYRHSRWLVFMERRLELAKTLLNQDRSVLVVTIDEKEVHHLGMLLEQMFPDAIRQMVTIVINAPGQARRQELARVDEYAFFIFIGEAAPEPGQDDLLNEKPSGNPDIIRWESLLRSGTNSRRADNPSLFYPVYIDASSQKVLEIGEPKAPSTPRSAWKGPKGASAVWPIKSDGSEGRWRAQPSHLRELLEGGFVRAGEYRPELGKGTIWYLGKAARGRIQSGQIEVVGRDDNGAVVVRPVQTGALGRRTTIPKTVWNRPTHHAGWHGSAMLRSLIPGRDFPFPKSLYAVEDALRIMVGGKSDALVLDFFAGSGTTAHALARLNASDGGTRRCILVTNNEVSAQESKQLEAQGLRPGDSSWEERGIFHHVTRPRIEAAVTGLTSERKEVQGEYADGSPIADGLKANVEFFDLTYEDPNFIGLGRKFGAVAPLLWLKAGGVGERIEDPTDTWVIPPGAVYGILADTNLWREFVDALSKRDDIRHAYIVTKAEATFQQIIAAIPEGIGTTQLYEDYLNTFTINTRSRA